MATTITLPYTTASGVYGTTFSSTYTWYVQYYQYPAIVDKMTSDAYMTINSFVPDGDVVQASITIYSKNAITRTGTSGYTCTTFTFKSQPTIKLNNVALGESIQLQNAALTKAVADNGAGTAVSGSIVHSTTITVSIPRTWFLTVNSEWNFTISDLLTIVDTSVTHTNSKTFTSFNVAPLFMMSVRKDGVLYKVNDITIRKDGVLYPADKMVMRVGGTLVQ